MSCRKVFERTLRSAIRWTGPQHPYHGISQRETAGIRRPTAVDPSLWHTARRGNARQVLMYGSQGSASIQPLTAKRFGYELCRCPSGSLAVCRPVAFGKIRQRTAQEPQTDYYFEQGQGDLIENGRYNTIIENIPVYASQSLWGRYSCLPIAKTRISAPNGYLNGSCDGIIPIAKTYRYIFKAAKTAAIRNAGVAPARNAKCIP
jgi:hypothetical protein